MIIHLQYVDTTIISSDASTRSRTKGRFLVLRSCFAFIDYLNQNLLGFQMIISVS